MWVAYGLFPGPYHCDIVAHLCLKFVQLFKINTCLVAYIKYDASLSGLKNFGNLCTVGLSWEKQFIIISTRYKFLAYPMTADVEPTASQCSKLLKKAGLQDWEVGKTKVSACYRPLPM